MGADVEHAIAVTAGPERKVQVLRMGHQLRGLAIPVSGDFVHVLTCQLFIPPAQLDSRFPLRSDKFP